VHPPEDPKVAVGRLDRPVAREIRPVTPVLALLVPAVLRVVDLHEPLRLAPDRLEDAGPRVADTDVPGSSASGLPDAALFVVNRGVDPEASGTATPRLHRLEGRQSAAQEPTVLGLPPGVDDDRRALADDVVVPAPHVRLDRFADRRHVLEP